MAGKNSLFIVTGYHKHQKNQFYEYNETFQYMCNIQVLDITLLTEMFFVIFIKLIFSLMLWYPVKINKPVSFPAIIMLLLLSCSKRLRFLKVIVDDGKTF